jgi:DMSO/TMAO reductase YedYZ heme-binding membrane subunit
VDPQHLVSFALDILLVIGALVAYLTRPRIGGQLARGLRILLVGVMILGLAHLIETLLFAVVQVDLVTNEIIHRVLIGIGFVFVILGFLIMRRAFYE